MLRSIAILTTLAVLCACGPRLEDKETGSKAVKAGAVGALGGLVYGLVMQDPDALRQAVAVGAAAATVTVASDAVTTTKADKKQDKWEKELGQANADAIVQLVKRDYAGMRQNLDKAEASAEPRQIQGASWLRTVLARDTGDKAAEEAGVQQVMKLDPKAGDAEAVKGKLGKLMDKLGELRKQYED